ncbi:MAG: ribosome biogenesis GTPase Der [Candidatus Malihini olakiniferum]
MIPVVALVGRQNVGKSTLFNCLTRTRDALVGDFPGLTRDRKYGRAEVEGQEFIIVDTGGGIEISEEGIKTCMTKQSLIAIEEADVVLFIVDARAGMMPADNIIAQHLRSCEKVTFLVANKIDGLDADSELAEFYALGFGKVYPMAASHGRGVNSLLENVLLPYLKEQSEPVKLTEEDNVAYWAGCLGENINNKGKTKDSIDLENTTVKLAIVGRPNVGKSTLINRILGEERMVVYDMPGTTRDSIYIPMEHDGCKYVLIDTAGVRKRGRVIERTEKLSIIKTLQAIEYANVVLMMIDAREGVSDQDLSLLGFILKTRRSLVIVVNKWDGLSLEMKERVKQMLDLRLRFIDFVRIHFVSALHGSGIGDLFESVHEAYICATKRISTATLTRIMKMASVDHQPPIVFGRRVKMKYAHAGGHNPPMIVIHGNQVKDLPASYKRYLTNYYRRSMNMIGTPIRIQFKEGENPFAEKRNTFALDQLRKRKRLMQHIKKNKYSG